MPARSCPHVYTDIGAIMPARIHRRRRDHACMYMNTLNPIMPARICTHMSDRAFTYMHTWAPSCVHLYAHIAVIVPARIWTHKCYLRIIHAYWLSPSSACSLSMPPIVLLWFSLWLLQRRGLWRQDNGLFSVHWVPLGLGIHSIPCFHLLCSHRWLPQAKQDGRKELGPVLHNLSQHTHYHHPTICFHLGHLLFQAMDSRKRTTHLPVAFQHAEWALHITWRRSLKGKLVASRKQILTECSPPWTMCPQKG